MRRLKKTKVNNSEKEEAKESNLLPQKLYEHLYTKMDNVRIIELCSSKIILIDYSLATIFNSSKEI